MFNAEEVWVNAQNGDKICENAEKLLSSMKKHGKNWNIVAKIKKCMGKAEKTHGKSWDNVVKVEIVRHLVKKMWPKQKNIYNEFRNWLMLRNCAKIDLVY